MDDRLIFDARYVVGNEQVDREHQKLFEIAGKVYDSLALDIVVPMKEIRCAIAELIEYTKVHFNSEESLMATTGYPGLAEHRRLHEDLISQIKDFEMRVELGQRDTPVDLYEFLCNWLGTHIQARDKAFGAFLAERDESRSGNGLTP